MDEFQRIGLFFRHRSSHSLEDFDTVGLAVEVDLNTLVHCLLEDSDPTLVLYDLTAYKLHITIEIPQSKEILLIISILLPFFNETIVVSSKTFPLPG